MALRHQIAFRSLRESIETATPTVAHVSGSPGRMYFH
jgi:hypothetical protein